MAPFKNADTVLIVTDSTDKTDKIRTIQNEVGSNGKVVPRNVTQLTGKNT
jgi:ribosomal protein S18